MSRTKSLSEGTAEAEKFVPGDGDVDVEIGDGLVEGVTLLLNPFGRAHEAFFLSVPTAKDDGAARTPALMEQSAEAANGFKHGGGSAGWIDRAVDPRVAVIADDARGVGGGGAWDFSDYIPDDAALVILLRDDVNFYAGGTEVIRKRQRTLPALRSAGAFERCENWRGVMPTERDGDDARLIAVWAGDIFDAGRV